MPLHESRPPAFGALVALTLATLLGACATAPAPAGCPRTPPPPEPPAEQACQDPALQRVPKHELRYVLRALETNDPKAAAVLHDFPADTRLAAACAYLAARPADSLTIDELARLARLGPPAALIRSELMARLPHPDADVRRKVTQALGRLGPGAAPDALTLASMGHGYLATNMGPAALPWLVAGLSAERLETRRDAAYALGRLGPAAAPAAPCLIEALLARAEPAVERAQPPRRASGGSAVSPFEDDRRRRELEASITQNAQTALRAIGEAAVPHLIAELDQRSSETAAVVAGVLATFRAEARAATPSLIALLEQPPDARAADAAAKALGAIGPTVITPVSRLLEADRSATRRHAVLVLSSLPGRPAARLLASALSDPAPEVRKAAAAGLLRLRDEARPALPELLEACRDPAARHLARQALAATETTDPAALPALLDALAATVSTPLEHSARLQYVTPNPDRGLLLDALARFGPAAAPAVPLLPALLRPAPHAWQAHSNVHALRVAAATSAADPRTAEALARLARARDPASPAAAALLLALDPPAETRAEWVESLGRATDSDRHLKTVLQVLPYLHAKAPAALVDALRAVPVHTPRHAAGVALLLAEVTHDQQASDGLLVFGLLSPRSPQRAVMADVLASRSPEARRALAARAEAIRELVAGHADPVAGLRAKLVDRDGRVALKAGAALVHIGTAGRAALPDLMAYVARPQPWIPLLEHVADALAAFGPEAAPARPDLERLCREHCKGVHRKLFPGTARALEHALEVIPPSPPPRAPAP